MIVSIHQPNYLPWPGFIHKIAHSDTYVVFDDVQFPRGKDFIVRNRIKTQNGAKWMRVPVKEKSSMASINQIEVNNDLDWSTDHWNLLNHNYSKARYFSDYSDRFKQVLDKEWKFLVDLNLEIIKIMLNILEIDTKIIRSSELKIKSSGTEKILDIIEMMGAKEYLTGWGEGSRRYLEGKEELFGKKGIKITKQNFECPVYPQMFGDFIPNLSTCDMLFNIGKEKTLEILKIQVQQT